MQLTHAATVDLRRLPSGTCAPFFGVVIGSHETKALGGPGPIPADVAEKANYADFLNRVESLPLHCDCKSKVIHLGERPYSDRTGCKHHKCRVREVLSKLNPAADGLTWEECFTRLDTERERCFERGLVALGLSEFDVENLAFSVPLVIHTVVPTGGRSMPAQAAHGDNAFGAQIVRNDGPNDITSTVYYNGSMPRLGHLDPNKLGDVKSWLWQILRQHPETVFPAGRSVILKPGEWLLFWGPVPHWSPKIEAGTKRYVGFDTAAVPGTPKHDDEKQITPVTLAVEKEDMPAAKMLTLAYAARGLKLWTNFPDNTRAHKILRAHGIAEYKQWVDLMAQAAAEQKDTAAIKGSIC